jgi:methylmalonyl-CoA/ethylmalonyl-CoA epimerase
VEQYNTISFLQNSIGQLGFVVKNIEEKIQGYYSNFGIGNWSIYVYEAPLLSFMHYHGRPVDYSFKIALSYFGNTRIELIEPLRGETIYADFIAEHGYGLHHLGIYVSDIKESIQQAKGGGFSVIMDGGGFGLDGDGHFAYLDTEKQFDICYELIQRPIRRHPPIQVFP